MNSNLKSVELKREEIENLEEGNRCSAGLMCRGLTSQNLPAFAGWYLSANADGHEEASSAYAFKFQEDPDGIYCEDCAIEIEECS